MTRVLAILWVSLAAAIILPCGNVAAQYPSADGRQHVLSQMTPPGTAAEWASRLGKATPEYFQPVRVSLPTSGAITFYEGSPDRGFEIAAPAQAGLLVGRMYRLKVSGLPEFPGIDFYPSIELIDRLHPPVGKAEEFPVEFELTEEELEWAASGRLVTKVVYLEQPDRIPLHYLESKERISTIEPFQNVIAEADLLGRPIAIVRLGGRTPDPINPEPQFYGPGGPIQIAQGVSQTQRKINHRTDADRPGVFHVRQMSARRIAQR